MVLVKVNSDKVHYGEEVIQSEYSYESSEVTEGPGGSFNVTPYKVEMRIKTGAKVPKTGLMFVGLGGNNGTTFTAMCLANREKLVWESKRGVHHSDFLGSVSQIGTFPLGLNPAGEEVFAPVRHLLPLLDPTTLEIDGWDISSMNLGEGLRRAGVFEWSLQEQLRPLMSSIVPRKAAFSQDFVAANQADRADNIIQGTKQEQLNQLRCDIQDFKAKKNLDKVIIMWVGNTERFSALHPGLNDTWANLEKSIAAGAHEISPSTLYAVAAALENCAFINGSPQNAMVPGVLELAAERNVFMAGDDLKTGQTKLKSVLMDYLVGAGLKPESVVSYNHLGNNDGKNLSAPQTFRSKEISKRGVIDDMVLSNKELFKSGVGGEKPDHLVVIKYVPYVGDSKRAMDEYTSAIAMGGLNTLVIHNTCEDSLLAAPIMLDLVVFMELFQRMEISIKDHVGVFHRVEMDMGQLLGYWLKAPLRTMTNSLFRQRAGLENLMRAALSLPASNNLFLIKGAVQQQIMDEKEMSEITNKTPFILDPSEILNKKNIDFGNVFSANNTANNVNGGVLGKKELYAA